MIDFDTLEDDLYSAWDAYLQNKLGKQIQILLGNQDIPEGQLENERVIYTLSTPHSENVRTSTEREVVASDEAEFENDIEYIYILNPRITISVNAYSGPAGDAREIAIRLKEWFEIKHLGNRFLTDNGYTGNVVQNTITSIQDRTTFLENDYQQRYGFDAALELEDRVRVRERTIETVDLDFNGEVSTFDT